MIFREANNLAAIDSLIVYRALRWGRNIDLILTDQHSFRSRDPGSHDEINPLFEGDKLGWVPEELAMQLDGGRDYAGGHPPAKLSFRGRSVANYRAHEAPQTLLGAKQKAWFLDRLRNAQATWKIWGNSLGTPDWRVDPQHLPPALGEWSGAGFALMGTSDWGGAYHERAEIFDTVRDAGITGFAIVSGDRHSFWAGYAAKALPPAAFEPVGVTFVGGSLISPGLLEACEHGLKKDNPLRPLYVANPGDGPAQPTVNLLLQHGVRSALEYASSGDLRKAHAAGNSELAPHLTFVDMGGHGYATVRVDASAMVTDFVCIPRPIERSPSPDGGPLRYRVRHEVPLWQAGERPRMRQTVVEGDPAWRCEQPGEKAGRNAFSANPARSRHGCNHGHVVGYVRVGAGQHSCKHTSGALVVLQPGPDVIGEKLVAFVHGSAGNGAAGGAEFLRNHVRDGASVVVLHVQRFSGHFFPAGLDHAGAEHADPSCLCPVDDAASFPDLAEIDEKRGGFFRALEIASKIGKHADAFRVRQLLVEGQPLQQRIDRILGQLFALLQHGFILDRATGGIHHPVSYGFQLAKHSDARDRHLVRSQ